MNEELTIRWAVISDPQKYVMDVLTVEADDIPPEKLNQGRWYVDTVALDKITVDKRMFSEHDRVPVHVTRRNGVVALIRAANEIKPLIVLGEELFLVDGYARYWALKNLSIQRARVLRQNVMKK